MFFTALQLAAAVSEAFGIKHVIDIGSGQGHLSRFLALCYKMNVATVEAETSHLSSAVHFDKQVRICHIYKYMFKDKLVSTLEMLKPVVYYYY